MVGDLLDQRLGGEVAIDIKLEPQRDNQPGGIARASRAHAEQVLHGQDLPAALERAKAAMKSGQPALLDIAVRLP